VIDARMRRMGERRMGIRSSKAAIHGLSSGSGRLTTLPSGRPETGIPNSRRPAGQPTADSCSSGLRQSGDMADTEGSETRSGGGSPPAETDSDVSIIEDEAQYRQKDDTLYVEHAASHDGQESSSTSVDAGRGAKIRSDAVC
jgi:hypothetical protein